MEVALLPVEHTFMALLLKENLDTMLRQVLLRLFIFVDINAERVVDEEFVAGLGSTGIFASR